jgi:predicted DsbA family dithiol-disulfide isomerase
VKLDIYSDTICPWCFVGKRRLEKALAGRPGAGISITWRPFELNPAMAAGGMARDEYLALKFGGPERARQVYAAIAEAGREEGIAFAFDRIRRTPNSFDSHRLIRYAGLSGRQDEVVEALFRGYFLDGLDIGDRDVLAGIGASAGLGKDELDAYLATEADIAETRADEARARVLGIDAVPCFIVNARHAISGAQPPETFNRIFDLAGAEEAGGEKV